MTAAETPARGGRRGLFWVGLVGVIILGAVIAGAPGATSDNPLDPHGTGPEGARGVVLLLEELGAEVDLTRAPDDSHDVALLLEDRLNDDGRDDLDDWVEAGGVLVVSDYTSELTPPVAEQEPSDRTVRGECSVAAVASVDEVEPRPRYEDGRSLAPAILYENDDVDAACFQSGGRSFLTLDRRSAGAIVALGGPQPLINAGIDELDNSVLAASLLAPTGAERIAFLTPPGPGEGDRNLVDLIAPNVKGAIVQLAVAFLLYALWRARRLGRPVLEPQPVMIAGSELVSAVGELLHQSQTPFRAGEMLQADLRRVLYERLGLAPTLAPDAVAEAVTARTGTRHEDVLGALHPMPVTTEAELVERARLIEAVRQEVVHVPRR